MGLAGKLAQPEPAPPQPGGHQWQLPQATEQAQAQPLYPAIYPAGEGAQQPLQQQQQPAPLQAGQQQLYQHPQPQPGSSYPQGQPLAYHPHPQGLVLASPSDEALIRHRLLACYQQNQLASFHVPQSIEVLAAELARRDVRGLAAGWELPPQGALDLTALALYDTVVLCDDSAAMRSENGEAVRQLRAVLERLAAVCGRVGSGVSLLAVNSSLRRDNVRTAADASDFVDMLSFEGDCPLGGALQQKVLEPRYYQPVAVGQLRRPLHVVILTGSPPSGEPPQQLRTAVQRAVQHFKGSRTGPGAIAFQFAQVGRSEASQAWLTELAGSKKLARWVDCTLPCEREQELLARVAVNAITRSFHPQVGARKRGFLARLFA